MFCENLLLGIISISGSHSLHKIIDKMKCENKDNKCKFSFKEDDMIIKQNNNFIIIIDNDDNSLRFFI